jgi:hypothetical protein
MEIQGFDQYCKINIDFIILLSDECHWLHNYNVNLIFNNILVKRFITLKLYY